MGLYPAWISDLLKDIESFIRTGALLVGGAWAYAKFVRGRVFRSRLEAHTKGAISVSDDCASLAISISVKNVGLSRVGIGQKGSGLRVFVAEKSALKVMISPEWRHLGTFPILEHHGWIEPGETVEEDRLAILPKGVSDCIRLELRVASSSGLEWVATSIVITKSEGDGDRSKLGRSG